MKYKTFIIDDEPLAIELIETYLHKIEDIEIIGKFDNALEAFQALQKTKVNILFLDIQMPQLSGLDLLKSLKSPPKVILTTAYREYAVESYELEILDYLLKPIRFERFVQALTKFYKSIEKEIFLPKNSQSLSKTVDSIFVRAERKMKRILFEDILYIQSIKDYVKIICKENTILTKQTLQELADSLPQEKFIRIHRSYIVAKSKITAYTAQDVEIGKYEIPIGRNYKSGFEGNI